MYASENQLPLEMLMSLMPAAMAPASGFGYQVEQDGQDGQPGPEQVPSQVPDPISGMYSNLVTLPRDTSLTVLNVSLQ
jgi:hypothetical protein